MTKTPLRAILARANTSATPNEALRPKPGQCDTSRRALFGFVGLAGVAVAMPTIVVASMPHAPSGVYVDYLAAEAVFNAQPDDLEEVDHKRWKEFEDRYHRAHDALKASTPTSLAEFAIYFDAVSDGSAWAERALSIVRDLAAKGGR